MFWAFTIAAGFPNRPVASPLSFLGPMEHSNTALSIILTEVRLDLVVEFLDQLSYSEQSVPVLMETKSTKDEDVQYARSW